MTTYGSIPGVKITTSDGTVSGVTIGRSQYLLLVGIGNDEATVDVNEPVQLESRADVDEKFGENSDVANAYRRATANGANPQFIRAVRASTSVESESFTDNSGDIAETPLVPDVETIRVQDDNDEDLTVKLDYNSRPDVPDGDMEIHVNPYTGEFESSEDVNNAEWEVADWDTAIASYKDDLVEGEFGVISPLTASTEVGETLEGIIEEMREDLKLVVGVLGAEYNGTDDGAPYLDAGDYEASFDNDNLWLFGPTALDSPDVGAGYGVGALSAVSGLMAGNDTTEPIYDSSLRGIGSLSQRITRADVNDLRQKYVCPLRDVGTVRLEDNRSSYDQDTNGGWERDFFRKRIVDLTMVTMYLIARRQIGGILDSGTVEDVEDAVSVELSNLVEDRLLEPDAQEVNVYRADDRTIGMDLTITPLGVAKGADIDLKINA